MGPHARRFRPSLLLVAALGVILIVLAALQYRWSGQVSQAERDRMQSNLNVSVGQFRNDYNLELQRICSAFQSDFPAGRSDYSEYYAQRYESWQAAAANPRLIAGLFLWNPSEGGAGQLQQLDPATRGFEPVPWPAHLEALRDGTEFAGPSRMPPGPRPAFWLFLEESGLLIQPLRSLQPGGGGMDERRQDSGYLLLELSQEALGRELLPELAQRYFGSGEGLIYQLAVLSDVHPDRILYQSDPVLSASLFSAPDARIRLFQEPRDFFGRPPDDGGPGARGRSMQGLRPGGQRPSRGQSGRPRTSAVIVPAREAGSWVLLARHHQGTLDEVVASQRRRNLALGFGILLLLAVSMGMILLSTQRANRLARLQMEFVAGVSHELRTPLSVICSAGDNLAEGKVVNSGERVRQYGDLIRQEGRRLTRMVEQILQFASSQAGRRRYTLQPAEVGELVEDALSRLQSVIEAGGFTVEKQIAGDLPSIQVDKASSSQCLENLIDNALKYSGAQRWIGVRAVRAPGSAGEEIRIAVEDRGIGIEPEDLEHIFEPFYRGQSATGGHIHGSGLGLSLAQEGAVAMGGRISVRSKPGAGCVFTLHIPIPHPKDAGGAAATATE